jgi:hypothetical protein
MFRKQKHSYLLTTQVSDDIFFLLNNSLALFSNSICNPFLVQAEISRLDPFKVSGNTGTLGRLTDSLSSDYNVNAFAVDTNLVPLEGEMAVLKTAVNSEIGFQRFDPSSADDDGLSTIFDLINGQQEPESNFFSQTWSSSLVSFEDML